VNVKNLDKYSRPEHFSRMASQQQHDSSTRAAVEELKRKNAELQELLVCLGAMLHS
jgi:hypothetical protein